MGIHDGHRERMRQRYDQMGADGFHDHEMLEMLLSCALPRVDTNPIAHELLHVYGSLHGICHAPRESLQKIPGIGPNAATLLRLIPGLCRMYYSEQETHVILNNPEKCAAYLIPRFIGRTVDSDRLKALGETYDIPELNLIDEGGIITATGILDVLAKDVLLKFIKSRRVLVPVTLIYSYIVNFLTAGGQTVAIIVTEQTFEDAFDRMGIHRRVLSRTLEDAGTLSAPIVPWGVATLYVMEVLGCGREYIPYCWFIFIVPIFSILCAFSGFGIWDKDGNKMWGRKKAAAK